MDIADWVKDYNNLIDKIKNEMLSTAKYKVGQKVRVINENTKETEIGIIRSVNITKSNLNYLFILYEIGKITKVGLLNKKSNIRFHHVIQNNILEVLKN